MNNCLQLYLRSILIEHFQNQILCFLSLFDLRVEERVLKRNIKDVLYSKRPILLFNNEIPENTNEYYANDTNTIIGYSNNNVNTNKDPLRGSTNVIDTKELDNGYKFVFDFATSQGNGLISSIALTSTWGGEGYCGSTYNHNAMKSVRNAYELTYGTSVTVAPSETENFFIHMVYWNPISDCFISVDCINKNTIRL